jgi:hypothetical protein
VTSSSSSSVAGQLVTFTATISTSLKLLTASDYQRNCLPI